MSTAGMNTSMKFGRKGVRSKPSRTRDSGVDPVEKAGMVGVVVAEWGEEEESGKEEKIENRLGSSVS